MKKECRADDWFKFAEQFGWDNTRFVEELFKMGGCILLGYSEMFNPDGDNSWVQELSSSVVSKKAVIKVTLESTEGI